MSEFAGLFEAAPFERAIDAPTEPLMPLAAPDDYVPEGTVNRGGQLTIIINQERVDSVLGTLMMQLEAERFPYNLDTTRVPQDPRHLPERFVRGDIDKAMFLFNLCLYMRGGIKSVDAVKRLTPLYNERPELFDAAVAAQTDPADIVTLLTKHGLGFQKVVSTSWVTNAQRLQQHWDGDPRNIFDGVTDYDESLKRVMNDNKGGGFKGFREKMTSMLIYYLMDEEMIKTFPFPIPVDLHVMRVSIANGLIDLPDVGFGQDVYTPQVTAALRDVYFNYAVDNGVNPLRLCDAVWLLSEALCGKHPGNQTLEPLGRSSRNGRGTYLVPVTVDQSDPVQQRQYEASCRNCPVEATCEYTLPGKPYYIGGVLFKRGYRERFEPLPPPPPSPQYELF